MIFARSAFVFFLSWRIYKMSVGAAQIAFWVFAAAMGASLSSIFLVYTGKSITQVFFVTAAAFGALSLWGYTTKKDLSGWGSFLIMGVFGIIIAAMVNIFLQSSALQFAISVIGVLVFAGLTAYDTQQIKDTTTVAGDATRLAKARHHGRAQPLPRLHQHVHHAPFVVRQPRVSGPTQDPMPSGPAAAGPFALCARLGQFRLASTRRALAPCNLPSAPPRLPTSLRSPASTAPPS